MSFASNGSWSAPLEYSKALRKELGQKRGQVGQILLRGDGVQSDSEEGIFWLRRGAADGDADAQYDLGRCYEQGRGVDVDVALLVAPSKVILRISIAICALGYCYAKGEGVQQDQEMAAKLFLRAAQLKMPEGQYNLAVCYARGRGVKKDMERAAEMYMKASLNGHKAATSNLGLIYEEGDGVAKDASRAVEIYKKGWKELKCDVGVRNQVDDLLICAQVCQYHYARCLFR